jgi:hypothetical protein
MNPVNIYTEKGGESCRKVEKSDETRRMNVVGSLCFFARVSIGFCPRIRMSYGLHQAAVRLRGMKFRDLSKRPATPETILSAPREVCQI